MEGPDRLAELLVAELKAMDAAHAESVVFPGDGAKWIWNRIGGIASDAGIAKERLYICLDYYSCSGASFRHCGSLSVR